MDYREIKTYAEGCLRDIPPHCSAACPYGLDVRKLITLVREERWDRAYRLYRDTVRSPQEVSVGCDAPCQKTCALAVGSGRAIDLPAIEREIVARWEAGAETRPPEPRYANASSAAGSAYPSSGMTTGGAITRSPDETAKRSAVEKAKRSAGEGTKQFAADEARRCTLCTCSACIDACTMIRWFRQNPKRIAADLGVTLLPVEGKIKHVASRMLNSCNLCGLCADVCPVGVDTYAAMAESRRLMREGGNIPAAFHEFWMADMAYSLSDEAYAVIAPEGQARDVSILFFPGCQLVSSLPGTVAAAWNFIRTQDPDAALLLACCGVPADWAGETEAFAAAIENFYNDWIRLGRPEVLYGCATCKKTIAKALPEVAGRLVYEWFAGKKTEISADRTANKTIAPSSCSVFDPCASDSDGRAAVRNLLGLPDAPVPDTSACCGFGGHIYPANPGLLGAVIKERTDAASGGPMITYCANCRDLFLSEGTKSRHILEILFPDATNMDPPGVPTLTQRRENRRLLKRRMQGSVDFFNGQNSVIISPELEAKMDRLLLLRSDIEDTIALCERENAWLTDTVSGHRIGHRNGRVVTVWVEYAAADDGTPPRLYNVYTHRMEVNE